MSRLKEEWRPVVRYEGLYEASDWGRIASLNYRNTGKWHLLTPTPDGSGYLRVGLTKNGKETTESVHLLVWDTFVGENRTGLDVNHIDENKENNCLWNLNLMTAKQNNNWGTRNERSAQAQRNDPKRSKPVIAKNAEGNVVYEFPSTREAGRNGFNPSAVAAACRGCFHRDGNHKYKGLLWYYKGDV